MPSNSGLDEIAYLDATAQAELVRTKQVTPAELVDAAIAALEVKLTKSRPLNQGMMQELITGRIRLV